MTLKNLIALAVSILVVSNSAQAAVHPSQRNEATGNKTGKYITDGFFAGGEKTVTSAKLKDIRRAKSNEGFERIVLDLEPEADSKNSIPYFQVQVSPNEGRVVVSIWANVMYDYDANRVQKAFAKSKAVKRLSVVPRVEEGLTIIEFTLNPNSDGKKAKLEAFRLSNPSRIIMDII